MGGQEWFRKFRNSTTKKKKPSDGRRQEKMNGRENEWKEAGKMNARRQGK